MATEPVWRTSRWSANNANCVQVRDSKNPTGPVLHADVPALLRAIRSGHLW